MRKLLAALLLALFAVAPAAAQLPNIQDNAVWGRVGSPSADGGSGPSQPIPFATLAAKLFGTNLTAATLALGGATIGTNALGVLGTSQFGGNISVGGNAPLAAFNLNIASVFDGSPNDAAALQVASVMYFASGAGTYTNGWGQFIAPAITSCANGSMICGSAPSITVTQTGGLRILTPFLGGTPAPTVTTDIGLEIDAQTAGANNFAIVTAGTTPSQFGGVVTTGGMLANGKFGYNSGAGVGASVTQLTSRATGVTLPNLTGKITLFGAVGSGTVACFTVTNTNVAITDTISVSQVAGTDVYNVVTKVAAGSFSFCFSDFSGTTNESPSFNINVIKGSIN
jgi:hypothetical protein